MNKLLIIILFVLFNSQLAFSETKVPYKIVDPRNIGTPEEQKKLADREFQICLEYVEYSTYYKFEPYLTKEKECGFHRDLLVNSEQDYQFYWKENFYEFDDPFETSKCIFGNCQNGEGILMLGDNTLVLHFVGKFKDGNFLGDKFYYLSYGIFVEIEKIKGPYLDLVRGFHWTGTRYSYRPEREKVFHFYNLKDAELMSIQSGEFKDGRLKNGTSEDFTYNYKYSGQFNTTELAHGYGKLEQNNNQYNLVMEGEFKDNYLANGYMELFEHSSQQTYKLEGGFFNGEPNGEVVITNTRSKDKDIVKTEIIGNFSSGEIKRGTIKTSGHSKISKNYLYVGELKSQGYMQISMHGYGEIKYDSGNSYKGQFVYNQRDGKGTYKFKNGDVYNGEFKNDIINGIGKMVYANGEIYEGKWTNGKPVINLKTDKKYYALVIGNNNYEHLEKLDAAVNDAKVIAEILDKKYDFEVELLLDANYETTVNKFYTLSRKLTKDDNFLVFYAGHGYLDKKQNRGYWLPVDAKSDLPSKWISNALIADELKATEAKHVLLIVDSCFSGSLMRSSEKINDNKNLNKKYIDLLKSKKTRLVISSGGNEPVVDSDGGDHSIFAVKLIDTLKNNDSVLTTQDIFENIRKYVASNAEQTPEKAAIYKAGHDGGDFLFFPK